MNKKSTIFLLLQKELQELPESSSVSLEKMRELGYEVKDEKFSVSGDAEKIAYTVHRLHDEDREFRNVPFCYVYSYGERRGHILKKPYSHYEGLRQI
jgi:hypothetical protein